MTRLTLALAAVAVAGFATPALAQDDAPFTGPRVELHGGWNWLSAHSRVSDGDTVTHATDHNNDGFFGGQIGYDRNFGGVVAGVFGSYDLSNNKECATAGTTTGCFKSFSSAIAVGRPVMSATPPGGNGTIIWIGFVG